MMEPRFVLEETHGGESFKELPVPKEQGQIKVHATVIQGGVQIPSQAGRGTWCHWPEDSGFWVMKDTKVKGLWKVL